MTVVLSGACFSDEESTALPCAAPESFWAPHPAKASQLRIAPGSHPLRCVEGLLTLGIYQFENRLPCNQRLERRLYALTFSSHRDLTTAEHAQNLAVLETTLHRGPDAGGVTATIPVSSVSTLQLIVKYTHLATQNVSDTHLVIVYHGRQVIRRK